MSDRPGGGKAIEARELAVRCAQLASDKKASNIVVLDLREHLYILDYFVICSGRSKRQLQTVSDEIEQHLKREGVRLLGLEGYAQGKWILMDCGDVVVHLMDEQARNFYDLELLWGDAPRVDWQEAARVPTS